MSLALKISKARAQTLAETHAHVNLEVVRWLAEDVLTLRAEVERLSAPLDQQASGSPPSPELAEALRYGRSADAVIADLRAQLAKFGMHIVEELASSGSTGAPSLDQPTPTWTPYSSPCIPSADTLHDASKVEIRAALNHVRYATQLDDGCLLAAIRSYPPLYAAPLDQQGAGSTGGAPTPNKCLMEWKVIVGKSGLPSAFGPTLDQQRILAGQCDFMNTLNSSWDDKPYRVVTLGEVSGAASRDTEQKP